MTTHADSANPIVITDNNKMELLTAAEVVLCVRHPPYPLSKYLWERPKRSKLLLGKG